MSEENTEKKVVRNNLKPIIIVSTVVLVMTISAFLVGIYSSGGRDVSNLTGGKEGKGAAEAELNGNSGVNEVVQLEPLVVNLQGERKMSYARIGIALGIYNPEPGDPVINQELMVPKITDRFLDSLGLRDASDLLSPDVKEELKAQLKETINDMLEPESGQVIEVYFTEFIVQ